MATRLIKSHPDRLAFRLNDAYSPATLEVAQDFSVEVDVQFGGMEHASYREGEVGALFVPSADAWVPGAQYVVLANRDGATTRRHLLAVPAADADYQLGLPIGGFTIGADNHPDPATAWDLETALAIAEGVEFGERRPDGVPTIVAAAGRKVGHVVHDLPSLDHEHRVLDTNVGAHAVLCVGANANHPTIAHAEIASQPLGFGDLRVTDTVRVEVGSFDGLDSDRAIVDGGRLGGLAHHAGTHGRTAAEHKHGRDNRDNLQHSSPRSDGAQFSLPPELISFDPSAIGNNTDGSNHKVTFAPVTIDLRQLGSRS